MLRLQFFLQSPSFLAHQEALAAGRGRSNGQTLFGMETIPSDNHIWKLLDGTAPEGFDGVFLTALAAGEAADGLAALRRRDGRGRIARDGTEHFGSSYIHCPHCSR